MALTKKKEPLYWGDIVDGQASEDQGGQQFIDVVSSPDLGLGTNEDYQIENVRKQTHLCKRF